MANGSSHRLSPEWDPRFTRMMGVSAVAHVVALGAIVLFATRSPPPPLPLVAYTVEITDPNALGGRLPPGAPGKDLSGGSTKPAPPEPPPAAPEPPAKAELPEEIANAPTPPPEQAAPPEPLQPPPTVPAEPEPPPQPPPTIASKEPEPTPVVVDKAPEPPKPEPKPEPPKPEPPKPQPPKPKSEPPKTTPSTVPPKPAAPPKPAPPAKPEAAAKPDATAKPAEAPKPGARGSAAAGGDAPAKDAYAAAAERWRSKAGGGLGGDQEGSGPVGSGGDGRGGGGQLVGIEFLSYRQRVIETIKSHWTNVIVRPGLVASVRFVIAADGEVSDVRLAQSSNNAAYDASVLRAVRQVTQLPPPPARYAAEFREFQIEFHSEETGGRGEG